MLNIYKTQEGQVVLQDKLTPGSCPPWAAVAKGDKHQGGAQI